MNLGAPSIGLFFFSIQIHGHCWVLEGDGIASEDCLHLGILVFQTDKFITHLCQQRCLQGPRVDQKPSTINASRMNDDWLDERVGDPVFWLHSQSTS